MPNPFPANQHTSAKGDCAPPNSNGTKMKLELNGRVAAVTGGASGIGWACAQMLASEGCRVALWDISPRTREIAATLSLSHGEVVDITEFAGVQTALHNTEAALGPVSHLIHAAAMGSGKFGFPFTHLTPSDCRCFRFVHGLWRAESRRFGAALRGVPPIAPGARRYSYDDSTVLEAISVVRRREHTSASNAGSAFRQIPTRSAGRLA